MSFFYHINLFNFMQGCCLTTSIKDVDVEKSRAQACASMPASYIANYIYCTTANF